MARSATQKRQTKTKESAAAESKKSASAAETDAIEMLKADHRKVESLFSQFESASSSSQKAELAEEICNELIIHAELEEKVFYPACRKALDDEEIMNEARVEHDSAKVLIADIMEGSPSDEFFDAKVKVLSEQIKHHVQEEEKKSQSMFAQAKKAELDTNALAQKMSQLKQQLKTQAEGRGLAPPQPSVFDRPEAQDGHMEMDMPRGQDRERDQYGRFTSDDDDYGRGASRARSRYDEDDNDRRSSSRGGYASRSGRYDDEDDRYSSRSRFSGRDQGRGGWFGDSEGHSEAARRGWESREDDRRGSRSRSRYEDDEGYSSRGGRGRGQGGWFGDPEGHSEAARRGWESREDDRSYSSRSGSRGGRYEDDNGYSSRGRSRSEEDDDRRSGSRGRDHGQGGWFGDPEGHSEASRRGWEQRR